MRAPSFPTEKDVDRVMAFEPFQPITGETADDLAKRVSDCRAAVAYTLRLLHEEDTTPLSYLRRQGQRYASKLRSANAALVQLDHLMTKMVPFDALEYRKQVEMLDRLRQQTDAFLTNEWIWLKRNKPDVARTRHAAIRAFYLLFDFWNITPTLTRVTPTKQSQGCEWQRLTELLCDIAIGSGKRDTWRACQWALSHDLQRWEAAGMSEDGHPRVRFVDPRTIARTAEDRASYQINWGNLWGVNDTDTV